MTNRVLFIFCPIIRRRKSCDGVLPNRLRHARHLSQIYSNDAADFRLVVASCHSAEPSKSEAPSPSLFSFFSSLHLPPKTMGKRPPPRVPPVRIASPMPHPHRHHRSVGCCVKKSSSGHSRPVLRPPRNIQMGAISATQRRGPNVARASPGAGRLHQAHREPRCRDSGPWRMMPWRGRRAKPLGGRVSSGSSCVLCFFAGG